MLLSLGGLLWLLLLWPLLWRLLWLRLVLVLWLWLLRLWLLPLWLLALLRLVAACSFVSRHPRGRCVKPRTGAVPERSSLQGKRPCAHPR